MMYLVFNSNGHFLLITFLQNLDSKINEIAIGCRIFV